MNAEPLLADRDERVAGASWRVAVARPAGNAGRLAAAEVLSRLRARGNEATALDIGRGSSLDLPGGDRAAHGKAYDLVLAIGDLSPAVMALGVTEGVPVAHVPLAPPDSSTDAVLAALAAGDVDVLPLLDVTVDSDRRFTTGSIAIACDQDDQEMLVAWQRGSAEGDLRTSGCRIDPPAAATAAARLEPSAAAPIDADRVRVDAGEAPLRVAVDRRTRRGRRISIASTPERLRILRLPDAEGWADRAAGR